MRSNSGVRQVKSSGFTFIGLRETLSRALLPVMLLMFTAAAGAGTVLSDDVPDTVAADIPEDAVAVSAPLVSAVSDGEDAVADEVILTLPDTLGALLPSVSAECAVLYSPQTKTVLCGVNAEQRRPMASTTKIMTALVVLENRDIDEVVKVDASAVGIEGSSVYLTAGEEITVETLLYALLLESANDAAAALAIDTAGSIEAFADMMNETASALGLNDTHFTNPHGLGDEDHYTTAVELAKITAAALENETFREIVSTERKTFAMRGGEVSRLFVNHNKLLRIRSDVIGVKTGFTKASGRCLVSAAEKDGLTLIAVTLNAPDDWNDHKALLDSGFASVRAIGLARQGSESVLLPVAGGDSTGVFCSNRSSVTAIVGADVESGDIVKELHLPHFAYAPVESGAEVGQARWYLDGQLLGSTEIYADGDVGEREIKKSIWQRIFGN